MGGYFHSRYISIYLADERKLKHRNNNDLSKQVLLVSCKKLLKCRFQTRLQLSYYNFNNLNNLTNKIP